MSDSIEVIVNGAAQTVVANATVADLLALLDLPGERVAVELNRRVVRRPAWGDTSLEAGDRLEIVHFVGGG